MAHKHMWIILLGAVVLAIVSGCQKTSRIDRVRSRWQQTIDEARLLAAEESIESGQPAFAERLLSDCRGCDEGDTERAEHIQQLRTRIQTEHYAKTGQSLEETAY